MSLISLVLPKATRWSAHKMLHAGFSTVGYITDVEGDLGFWKKNLQSSTVLQQSEPHDLISLKEDSKFVFGGDVCDRGKRTFNIADSLIESQNFVHRNWQRSSDEGSHFLEGAIPRPRKHYFRKSRH